VVVDTNVLLEGMTIPKGTTVVITAMVLRELEKLKLSNNPSLAFEARRAVRWLEQHRNKLLFDLKDYKVQLGEAFDPDYADNKLIQCCLINQYALMTHDLLLKQKAAGFGIPLVEPVQNNQHYAGYLEVEANDPRYTKLCHNIYKNHFDLLINQYLIVRNEEKIVDLLKWNGEFHVHVRPRGFETSYFGKFAPRDVYQRCALDSLKSNALTMIKGKAGSGKSLIALNFAMREIELGHYNRLICFVNPMAVRNSAKLGYYPGTRDEKIMDSAIGSMLLSKFGDRMILEELIKGKEKEAPKLILLPFSDLRGFDTTGMKAIVYIIEAQNLSIDLMKLALQRVGEDSKMIIDGDFEAQVDHVSYESSNNGMARLSEVFRGEPFYGEVELPIIYRSKIARKADEM
jgi:predicted ribonuclease YlaK